MNDVIEQQQTRAEAISAAAADLLKSECALVRALAERISTDAALIAEDCQIALDAS